MVTVPESFLGTLQDAINVVGCELAGWVGPVRRLSFYIANETTRDVTSKSMLNKFVLLQSR